MLFRSDRYVVDGGGGEVGPGLGVNGVAWGVREILCRVSDAWDRYIVDGLVNLTAFVLDNFSYVFRALQNGLIQHYALLMIICIFFIVGAGKFLLGLY